MTQDSEPPTPESAEELLQLRPIGRIYTPHQERHNAPRQGSVDATSEGRIELLPAGWVEHALIDLDTFSHIWVLFWFHRNHGFRAKVAPPRSSRKRGVFATRSPYRPNPLGLSLLRLIRIEGHVLHVQGVDLLDSTPVLDIKPYLPYADQAENASDGWLTHPHDPAAVYAVSYSTKAEQKISFLAALGCTFLKQATEAVLSLGPAPHPYRRIRHENGNHYRVAVQDFRLRFTVEGQKITVEDVFSGYKRRALARPDQVAKAPTPLSVHRAFIERFG